MKSAAIIFLSVLLLGLSVTLIVKGRKAVVSESDLWTMSYGSDGNLLINAFVGTNNIVVTEQRFIAFGDDSGESGIICRIVYRNKYDTSWLDEDRLMFATDTSDMLLDWTQDLFITACGEESPEKLLEYYREKKFAEMISQGLGKKLEQFVREYNKENPEEKMNVEILAIEMIANERLREKLGKK